MNGTQVKLAYATPLWLRIVKRTLTVLVVAVIIGLVMRQVSQAMDRSAQPAGFCRGVLQGALMPCALPNLIVGQDVTIYSEKNTGVPYKLGYTVGVNACGAVFFGIFFWRLNRWRKRLNGGKHL